MFKLLRRRLSIAPAVLLLLAVMPTAEATTEGTLEFTSVALDGSTIATFVNPQALQITGSKQGPPAGSWTLTGTHWILNRTWVDTIRVGSVPTNPDSAIANLSSPAKSTQRDFAGATASATWNGSIVGILVVPGANAAFTITTSVADLRPAPTEKWIVGHSRQGTASTTPSKPHALDRATNVTGGQPLLNVTAAAAGEITGTFTVMVWGPEVKVKDANGQDHRFRSGVWEENATAATSDRHEQIIELRVANGTFSFLVDSGTTRATGRTATLVTLGRADFFAATGRLTRDGIRETINKGLLQIAGEVRQEATGGSSPGTLEAHVSVDDKPLPSDAEALRASPAAVDREASTPVPGLVVTLVALGLGGVWTRQARIK